MALMNHMTDVINDRSVLKPVTQAVYASDKKTGRTRPVADAYVSLILAIFQE